MQKFLRKWHRWIAFPATIFLLFAAITGILLAATEFFGEEEALRERTRSLVSTVTTQMPDADFAAPLARARAAVATQVGGAPLDKVVWQFKGETPTVTFFLGKPTGGEDRKVTVDARTGIVLRTEAYTDKPFLVRLHSGEWFGDGGLVMAMFWGLALVLLSVSGIIIYFKMRRPNLTGLRRIFWLLALGGLAAIAPGVRADSPFYTDDPVFSPGWETKMGITGEHNSSGSSLTEVLDWNYAVVPSVRLNLTTLGAGYTSTIIGHSRHPSATHGATPRKVARIHRGFSTWYEIFSDQSIPLRCSNYAFVASTPRKSWRLGFRGW